MSEKTKEAGVDARRRDFLKGAGVAGGAAVLALASEVQAEAEITETGGKKSLGYRETEHVRAYYETARI